MFQSRFNHRPYSLGFFFRLLSPLEFAKLSCRHRRTDLAMSGQMSCQKILPKSMSNRKVHCNLSNQYHIIIIYIYIFIYVSSIVGNQGRYRFELSFEEGLTFFHRQGLWMKWEMPWKTTTRRLPTSSWLRRSSNLMQIGTGPALTQICGTRSQGPHSLAGRSLRVLIRSEVECPEMA